MNHRHTPNQIVSPPEQGNQRLYGPVGDKEQKERKEITEMKKFLSILLALAVGFTFTFGSAMSAFAEPADNTKVTEATVMADTLSAANYAKAQEKTAMDNAIDALFGNETVKTFNGTNVSKASVTAVFTKVYEEATADIDKQYNEKLAAIQAAIIADNASEIGRAHV